MFGVSYGVLDWVLKTLSTILYTRLMYLSNKQIYFCTNLWPRKAIELKVTQNEPF